MMKKDHDAMDKRQSELTDSVLQLDRRVKACDKCIKELESEVAASSKKVVCLSPWWQSLFATGPLAMASTWRGLGPSCW